MANYTVVGVIIFPGCCCHLPLNFLKQVDSSAVEEFFS